MQNNNFKISTNVGATVLDEVQEIITLPGKAARYKQDPMLVQLDPKVITQVSRFGACSLRRAHLSLAFV